MFSKILVANRGEIAVRIIKACKSMGIKTVAVYSKADRGSLHTLCADESYCIGPAAAKYSYMNQEALITSALFSRSEAIHPGYGFLSENADFAKMCNKNNLSFIGPSSEAIRLVSNKFLIKQIAKSLNIPIASAHLIDDITEIDKKIMQIGYPVILKIMNGCSREGLHVINGKKDLNELKNRLTSKQNSSMYIEKYIENVKHIAVHVLADQYGKILILGDCNCSIQEKHKKLVEECPASSISNKLRDRLYDSAYKIATAINYHNAGTVEFLVDKNENFYFMNFNTRIQVEHGVTEMVTGIDIVNWQIKIADGLRLHIKQEDIKPKGHAIECRIYVCTTGLITNYQYPKDINVRFDHMITNNTKITPYYDPLIGKMIVCEADRKQAINKMKQILDNMDIDGLETNIELHKKILGNPLFLSGDHLTNFISHKLNCNKKMNAREKFLQIIDPDSFTEYYNDLISTDIICFNGYNEKLIKAKAESDETEAVITGTATINKIPCIIIVFEPLFMMGSMGTIVGEKITKAFELATKKKLSIIAYTASGGARMQEGVFSLMQMIKTSAAVKKHSQKGLLFISVISNPTLGGVSASFASLADIIIMEDNAVYGFTGKRIIEETTKLKLSDDFQTAEFAKKYGQVDIIVKQNNLYGLLMKILNFHTLNN